MSLTATSEDEEVALNINALHCFFTKELNNLVHNVSLFSANLLASRLKQKNLLSDSACINFLPQQTSRVPPEGHGVLYRLSQKIRFFKVKLAQKPDLIVKNGCNCWIKQCKMVLIEKENLQKVYSVTQCNQQVNIYIIKNYL